MNKENCALRLVDEVILYYDAWSKKHQIVSFAVKTYKLQSKQQFYYNLLLQGYMFRLLRVIIRPSNEPTQDYLLPSALGSR